MLAPIDSTVEENDIDNFLSNYDSRTSQSSEKKLVDFELARAEALQSATLAFEELDVNGKGNLNFHEAEKLIKKISSSDNLTGNHKDKVDAFFKSFDEESNKIISKNEWLSFYGKLLDSVTENRFSDTLAIKQ